MRVAATRRGHVTSALLKKLNKPKKKRLLAK